MARSKVGLFGVAVILLAMGSPVVSGPRAPHAAYASSGMSSCKHVVKKVHGKKKRVRVCRSARPTPTPTPSLEKGMKVDVGGYRLWVQCVGTGSPTVVIVPGIGGDSLEFEPIQKPMSAIARTCIYDRAGAGASDPPPAGYDGTMMVEEIRNVLLAVHVPGPYVLLGHSFGGLLVRMYAYTHKSEVVGMILDDSVHEQQCGGPCSDWQDVFNGVLTQITTMTHGTIKGSLGDLPLIVLTAGQDCPGACEENWVQLQNELATASSNSVHVIALKSGHGIHVDAPAIVLEAVREVVAASRSSSHLLPPCGQNFEQLGGQCMP